MRPNTAYVWIKTAARYLREDVVSF